MGVVGGICQYCYCQYLAILEPYRGIKKIQIALIDFGLGVASVRN